MEEWNNTILQDFYSTQNTNRTNLEPYIAFRDGSRFWISRILLPIVVFVGIIGNGMTVVVLSKRRMRSSTNSYLTALAVSDLLYLLFVFTLSLEHYPNITNEQNYYYWVYRRFGLWLTDATNGTSIWLTVSFTVERYIAVCHPMTGKMMCTESRARIVIILVYILSFLITITTPFECETTLISVDVNNVTKTFVKLNETSLGRNETYKIWYYRLWSIIFVFLPLLLLGVFNSFLINAVHKSRKTRREMTQGDTSQGNQSQENKITITLIAVVVLFMICQTPTAIILIYHSLYTIVEDSKGDVLLRGFGNIINFLVTINAAANFILYCALSAKYRRTLLQTFFRKCYKTSSPFQSSAYTPECSNLVRGSTTRSTCIDNSTASRMASSCYLQVPNNGVLKRQSSLQTPKKKISYHENS